MDNPMATWQATELRGHPLVGKIWSRAAAGFVSLDGLAVAIGQADYALLGEVHDNPDAHRLQAWALRQRAASGRSPVVVMEMLDEDQKAVLDRVFGNNGSPSGSAADRNKAGRFAVAGTSGAGNKAAKTIDAATLLKQLGWDKSGWPDARIYRPIFEAVLDTGGRFYPGSAPRRLVREIGKTGFKGLKPAQIKALLLDQTLPAKQIDELVRELKEGHCNMLPDQAIPAMVKVQRFRDAKMARVMVDAGFSAPAGRQKNDIGKATLIAGNGHVRRDRAVPWYLRKMQPKAKITVMAVMEVREDERNAGDYFTAQGDGDTAADFIVFVPRQSRPDQCAALRKMFSRTKPRKNKAKSPRGDTN